MPKGLCNWRFQTKKFTDCFSSVFFILAHFRKTKIVRDIPLWVGTARGWQTIKSVSRDHIMVYGSRREK